jgi:leader peptidase (prepilin peptidase)/N-methyltransferase
MAMDVLPALVGAAVGLVGGFAVPRLVAWCPEPEHDPTENPDDFPDHVPFAELAARPGLAWRSAAACAVAGALVGLVTGWGWSLLWLLPLIPVLCALTVIDFVTWYLPSRLIRPSWAAVAGLLAAVAVVEREPGWVLAGVIGFLALGGYYGLMRLLMPRGMAGGDVRLGALLGLALGPLGLGALLVSVLAASLLSVVAYLPMLVRGRAIKATDARGPLQHRVSYGPFLVLGALVAVVVGQVLST